MIRRLYVNNFRCLEDFELRLEGCSSVLLLGRNGAGKSTVGSALEVLQKIARGVNSAAELVDADDVPGRRLQELVSFHSRIELSGHVYQYAIDFGFVGRGEPIVRNEELTADDQTVFKRDRSTVFPRSDPSFRIDHRLAALPILQEESEEDPLFVLKNWLARMLILRPIPSLISGDSGRETLQPDSKLTDFAAWFSGLMSHSPPAYSVVESYLRQVMPDLRDIQNPRVGNSARTMTVQFAENGGRLSLPFERLSDGEKCFMICAAVLAAVEINGSQLCFWDEPDNYLALDEVGHMIVALRSAFRKNGQFIATSHNPEAIRRFSTESTLYLHRKNHLEPTVASKLSELTVIGDLVDALIRGDVEP